MFPNKPRNIDKSFDAIGIQLSRHLKLRYSLQFTYVVQVQFHQHKIQQLFGIPGELRVLDCPYDATWRTATKTQKPKEMIGGQLGLTGAEMQT